MKMYKGNRFAWVIYFYIIFMQFLLLGLNAFADNVQLNSLFQWQDNPDYFQILAVLPSIMIIFIILIRLYHRYYQQRNQITFLMFNYILFLWLALFAAMIGALLDSPSNKLDIYFDRTIFNLYVVSGFFLYLFMNEVFRYQPGAVKINEKIMIVISFAFPIFITAIRQVVELPNIIESIGLALAGLVILIPNIGVIIFGMKILHSLKVDNNLSHPDARPLRYIISSSAMMLVFAIIFVVLIMIPQLNRTWLYWANMLLVIVIVIAYYRGYLKR